MPIEASSPGELHDILATSQQKGQGFAGIRILGQNILTRQFNFPHASIQDLIAGLKLEASETLSVDPADVELSYQITGTDEKGVQGIFIAMPHRLLMEYLECFNSHPMIPVTLTSSALGAVNDFFKDQPLAGDNFCLVNFLKPHAVSIIIFANARPTLFRELYHLTDSDLKDKITDTIRYSCSYSASKNIEQIFFVGDLKGKEELMKGLKELKNFSKGSPAASGSMDRINFTNLNLLEKFVCQMPERGRLVFVFSLVCAVSLLLALVLAWNFSKAHSKLHEAKSRMNMKDYTRALDLQEQVRQINHE